MNSLKDDALYAGEAGDLLGELEEMLPSIDGPSQGDDAAGRLRLDTLKTPVPQAQGFNGLG